jgi:hypothetical protein
MRTNRFTRAALRGSGALALLMILVLGAAAGALAQEAGSAVPQGKGPTNLRDLVALPLTGPGSGAGLDATLDALAEASGLAPATAKSLRSLAGKQALWEALADDVRERRSAILAEAVAGCAREACPDGELSALFRPVVRHARGLQPDIAALQAQLQGIARSLRTDSELAERLRGVLRHPAAAEAVYLDFVYPIYLAAGGVPRVEDVLARGAQGGTALARSARGEAKAVVDLLEPVLSTVAREAAAAARDADRVVAKDALHRAYKEALEDPLTTSIMAALSLRRGGEVTAEQLREAIAQQRSATFSPVGDSLVLAEGLSPGQREENLMVVSRLRAVARANAERLRTRLADFDANDGLDRDFRAVMTSDLAAALLIPDEALRPAPDVFLASSILGTALVSEGGDWSINPHRTREVGVVVAHLELRLRDHEAHREALGAAAEALGGGGRLAELGVLQIAVNAVLRDVDGLAGRWIRANFEKGQSGYRVRPGKAQAIADIAKAAPPIPDPLTLSMDAGRYSDAHTHLLRSSTYLYLRSEFAHDVYFNEFDDHYAARLWGIFDWNAQQADDPDAFRRALEANAPLLRRVAATHEKVIIYVFHTPKWLTGSRDRQEVDGRPAYLLHSPKDYAAWRRHVGEVVRFLKRHLAGTEIYYEVWNEPDIYWLEGNKAYLRLYAETAAAIREADPTGKVGGAAMNAWEGKAKGDPAGAPLNMELIRYAAAEDVPLDFVSWHVFERPISDLEAASEAYLGEIGKLGLKPVPELVISEWSIPGRGSRYEAVAFAEYMAGLHRLGPSIQTVAVWEEFVQKPRPGYLAPWGMLTDQGYKKPMFHVHSYFDRLSRASTGIAAFESPDQRTRVIVSRKRNGTYELVLWETRHPRPLEAALDVLKQSGLDGADLSRYGSIDALESAIRAGQARDRSHAVAFRKAAEVYGATPTSGDALALRFPGAKRLRVISTEAVGIRPSGPPVFTSGGDLLVNLPRGEVMWIRLAAD